MQSVMSGDWVYCLANDGKYYKYNAVSGSLASAVEIAKAEYDSVATPSTPAEKADAKKDAKQGDNSALWIVVAIAGALVVLGIGAFVMIRFMRKKNDSVDEILSADEDDGFFNQK